MNSSKKIEKGRIADFISDSTLTELNKRILKTAIVDGLASTDGTVPLSANQGRVLKGLIDTINGVLQSDDGTLDELQEIVNYIKQNKTDLESLSISNIAGLSQALIDAETNANQYTDQELGNITALTKTGTALDLSNREGNNYNYASPLTSETYTFSDPVINGFARCFINAANQPVVTGASYLTGAGDVFQLNTPMEMVVESPDGSTVEYYFLKR
jgi:hypothetical protein